MTERQRGVQTDRRTDRIALIPSIVKVVFIAGVYYSLHIKSCGRENGLSEFLGCNFVFSFHKLKTLKNNVEKLFSSPGRHQ